MPIRFQADADLNQIIVSAIIRRVPQIDFRTATSAGLAGMTDGEVLALAARDGRLLVTPSNHDAGTFRGVCETESKPGLIVAPQSLAVRAGVDDLILIWTATRPDEWINRVMYLPI